MVMPQRASKISELDQKAHGIGKYYMLIIESLEIKFRIHLKPWYVLELKRSCNWRSTQLKRINVYNSLRKSISKKA